MQSELFKLASSDIVKAVVVAILTPVVGYVLSILQSGSLTIDWHQILILALSGGLGYLVKNFLSDSQGRVLGVVG